MRQEKDMNEIAVGTAHIPYRTMGTGRPLVFVHGGSPGSRNWEGMAAAFEDTRTVVLPELSGSDAARDDGGELTVELLAEQVAAVITAVGQGPADVVGHSMGSAVVNTLAAERPELVRRLVTMAGFPAGDGNEFLRNALTVWLGSAGDADNFARLTMLLSFSRSYLNAVDRATVEELAAFFRPEPGRLGQIGLALRLDVRDLLPRIQAPTLVIGCVDDPIVPVESPRELAATIPGAVYAEVVSGHIPMIEKPDELIKLVRDFLD
ncbi:alpha/beta hydrolase [Nocardia seriolae]|nr:alpha/beta hydrolase [Nocardia seriolae]